MVDIRKSYDNFLPKLCDAIEAAVEKNGEGMSNTSNAGVSHGAILDAVWNVREALRAYGWECEPGWWLIYTLLLHYRSLLLLYGRTPETQCGSAPPSVSERGLHPREICMICR